MTSESLPGKGIRVLLVDGNATLAIAVKEVLEASGFQVSVAPTDPAVRDFVAREKPVEVVILDARIGDADGHEILSHIRSDSKWKLVRVIMMTSLDSTHDVRRARRAGADDYLFKPVRPERLVEHVLRLATSP